MASAKFAVVANCQARPLSQLVKLINPGWEHLGDVIVHLSDPGREAADHAMLEGADVIFAQLVNDQYPAAHLATSRLKARFGDAVLTWPNLFFHGQNPDSVSLTSPCGGRLTGPLIEYHSLTTYRSWLAGLSMDECVRALEDPDAGHAEIRQRAEQSLEVLKTRERESDIRVCNFIEARYRGERLFHVYHHPTTRMMLTLARKLLRKLGEGPTELPSPDVVGEPLGSYVPLTPPAVPRALALKFATSTFARGVELAFGADGAISTGRPRIWGMGEFVEASFRCYDAQADLARGARITPAL